MSDKMDIIWSDLDHRLIQDAAGALKKVDNVKAVMTSVDNILRTSKGERVMLPEFGSSLKDMVFESMNSPLIDLVSQSIKEEIEYWDNRVNVTQIRYLEEPDNNSIIIEIAFAIKGYSQIFKTEVAIRGEAG